MNFSENEIRMLCAANQERGWPPVPDDCPPIIKHGIVERRARALGVKANTRCDSWATEMRRKLDAAMVDKAVKPILPALTPSEVQSRLARLNELAK